jgi:dynein heavy chain, axonemal
VPPLSSSSLCFFSRPLFQHQSGTAAPSISPQTHARKTRLAIDTLDFRSEVMRFENGVGTPGGALPPAPPNGVYIYGMYLEGARWDNDERVIAEMRPGQLYHAMPTVWLEPVLVKELAAIANAASGVYACPFYKTSKRAGVLSTTGHSTNFITTMFLRSDQTQDHWVRRGVALLSQLDD